MGASRTASEADKGESQPGKERQQLLRSKLSSRWYRSQAVSVHSDLGLAVEANASHCRKSTGLADGEQTALLNALLPTSSTGLQAKREEVYVAVEQELLLLVPYMV